MIQLNPIYKPVYTTKKRYILVTGGRGSAKSFNIAAFGCLLTYEERQRILFTRYTMTSAEISVIPEFKDKIDRFEVNDCFKVNNTDITNKATGSDILFRGIKASSGIQTANLKSISGVSCWVVDEGEELKDENIFDTIDLSIRVKEVQNRVIIIMNSSNRDHWIYRRWIENTHRVIHIDGYPVEISTHPEVLHIHTTYLDNLNNLNQSFIDKANSLKKSSPKIYGIKMIGQWSDIGEGKPFVKSLLKVSKEIDSLTYSGGIAYIDVADEGEDFTSLVIARTIDGDMNLYITDVVLTDSNSDVSIPLCAEALIRNKVRYCRVESNNMGAMFRRGLDKVLRDKKAACELLPAVATTNKLTRIIMEGVFVNEYFIFRHESIRSANYEEYLNQLCSFTKDDEAEHDDAADATSGLAIFIRAMIPKYY